MKPKIKSKYNDWYFAPAKEKMGSFKAIKHRITGELALEGKYGSIWMFNATTCKALITSGVIINRYTNPSEKYKTGEHRLIKFPLADLPKWVEILHVKNNRKSMIKKANQFRETV